MSDIEKFLEPGASVPIDAQTTGDLVRELARIADDNARLRSALKYTRTNLRMAIQEIDNELDYEPLEGEG
jgi:hypothetical protein